MDKDYYKKVYDKIWDKQTKAYGFGKYEKYIVREIIKRKPQKVFEVGIGNGWPIAITLKRRNIEVMGCDVARSLVEKARENLQCTDRIYEGTLQEISIKDKFDVVYCVRTSWYIPDFFKVLNKMISMMKEEGYIVFDIMEKESLYYGKQSYNQFVTKLYHFIGLNAEGERKLYFYSRCVIERWLKKHKIKFYSYNERRITGSKDYINTPKRIYVCKKEM